MNKITFEGYKGAIRAQYDAKKMDDVSGILLSPSPAQLRNFCLMLFDSSISKKDENILRLFFKEKGEEDLRKEIENCDIGKFKPIISFLKGEKDSDNVTRIELAAILVDFNPRPYAKYLQNGNTDQRSNAIVLSQEEKEELDSDGLDSESGVVTEVAIDYKVKPRKKTAIVFASLLSLFFMGYTAKDMIFPEKECMKWEGNHYEAVDCVKEEIGQMVVIPFDENMMKLKKLDSNSKLIFFKNDKPIVWYSKHDGVVELFNGPGFHPETGKPLKPITKYMIRKYNLK